jgi:hypothetical protein
MFSLMFREIDPVRGPRMPTSAASTARAHQATNVMTDRL